MAEVLLPPRPICMHMHGREQIAIEVSLGERGMFSYGIVEMLGLVWRNPLVLTADRRLTPASPEVACFSRSDRPATEPSYPERIRFSTEARQNTLGPLAWSRIFPEDLASTPDILVPRMGRTIWRHLVAKGKIAETDRVVAIDVASIARTRLEYDVFDSMRSALAWAHKVPTDTVYLTEYAPEAADLFEETDYVVP